MPEIVLIRVDLPAPLSPTRAVIWPGEDVEVDAAESLHGAEGLGRCRAGSAAGAGVPGRTGGPRAPR